MKPPHVLPFERPAAELQERIDTLEPMVNPGYGASAATYEAHRS